MKQALFASVKLQETRKRLTLEALADVDAGRIVDHEAVVAWADSLEAKLPVATKFVAKSRRGV